MNSFERAIVFGALIGQVTVIALGVVGLNTVAFFLHKPWFSYLSAVTFLLSVCTLILILRDLYKRKFDNPNSKLTWLLVILLTAGIGLVIYVFRYAVKPRGAAINA